MSQSPTAPAPVAAGTTVGRFTIPASTVLAPRALAVLRKIAPHFEASPPLRAELVRWVRGQHLSKRLIDYALTNYAKSHRPAYSAEVVDFETGRRTRQHVSVYSQYNARLRHYKRPLFDAFRRRARIEFTADDDGATEETTVAQLNFLVWAVQYRVLDFCQRNQSLIEADMRATHLAHRKRRAAAAAAAGGDHPDATTTIAGTTARKKQKKRRRQELKPKPRSKIFVYPYDKLHDIPTDADEVQRRVAASLCGAGAGKK